MSSAETGRMSAVRAGQISAVETRQMSTIATGLCPVLILYYICLVSTAVICPVPAADICPVSTEDIWPVSTADAAAGGWLPAESVYLRRANRQPLFSGNCISRRASWSCSRSVVRRACPSLPIARREPPRFSQG